MEKVDFNKKIKLLESYEYWKILTDGVKERLIIVFFIERVKRIVKLTEAYCNSKLLKKLESIQSGELTIEDYIKEVKGKL